MMKNALAMLKNNLENINESDKEYSYEFYIEFNKQIYQSLIYICNQDKIDFKANKDIQIDISREIFKRVIDEHNRNLYSEELKNNKHNELRLQRKYIKQERENIDIYFEDEDIDEDEYKFRAKFFDKILYFLNRMINEE